jgi:hypothetical protein
VIEPISFPPLFSVENKDDWFALIGKMLYLSQRLKIGRKLEVVCASDPTLQLIRQFDTNWRFDN